MSQLENRVVLVTGGAGGLGTAICESLADAGAILAVMDLEVERMRRVVSSIARQGGRGVTVVGDVSRSEDCWNAVSRVQDEFGTIDVLINNAAIDRSLPIESFSSESWDEVLRVNLHGAFYMTKAVFALMREKQRGHIVNIASTASKRCWANATAYHASKWGLLGLSHALHVEGRPHGIKVTAVVSGGMHTPFLLDRFPDIDTCTLQHPRHVADTVRFVLSQPEETVIPEVMVLPMRETSWP